MKTTTAEAPLADRLVQVTRHIAGEPVTVTGERTECPYLTITPALTKDGIAEDLILTHIPTGCSLGRWLLSRQVAAAETGLGGGPSGLEFR